MSNLLEGVRIQLKGCLCHAVIKHIFAFLVEKKGGQMGRRKEKYDFTLFNYRI